MDRRVPPHMLTFGDQVVIRQTEYMVKGIDGPDRIGTYDLYLVDRDGRDHMEIVSEAVTLHL